MATVWPAPNVPVIVPSDPIVMLLTVPAADPFWLIDEVVDGDE